MFLQIQNILFIHIQYINTRAFTKMYHPLARRKILKNSINLMFCGLSSLLIIQYMKSKSFLKSPEYANYLENKSVWEHLNQRKVKKWNYRWSRKQRNGDFFIGKLLGGRKGYIQGKFFTLSNFIYKLKECNAYVCFSLRLLQIHATPCSPRFFHARLPLTPSYSLCPQAPPGFTEQLLPWKTDLYLPSEGRNEGTLFLCALHILQEGESGSEWCKGQDVRLRLCTSTELCTVPPSNPRLTHLTPKSFVLIPRWRGSAGNGKLFPGH